MFITLLDLEMSARYSFFCCCLFVCLFEWNNYLLSQLYCYFSWTNWFRKGLDHDQSFFVGAEPKSTHLVPSSPHSLLSVLQWNCWRHWEKQQNKNSWQTWGNQFSFFALQRAIFGFLLSSWAIQLFYTLSGGEYSGHLLEVKSMEIWG